MDSKARPRMTIVGGGGKMARVLTRFLLQAPRVPGVSPLGPQSLYLVDPLFRESSAAGLANDLSREFDRLPFWVNYDIDRNQTNSILRWYQASQRCKILEGNPSPSDQLAVPALLALLPRSVPPTDLEKWVTTRADRSSLLRDSLEPQGLPLIHLIDPADAKTVLQQSDITMFAVPYRGARDYETRIAPYVPHLRSESLVIDITSIKQLPLAVMERLIPKNIAVLGTHPLFGDAVANPLGQVVAIVESEENRYKSHWAEWLRSKLVDAGMLVTPSTVERHDEAMSYVQVLTHFVLLSLASCFRAPAENLSAEDLLTFRSPIFEPLIYLAARVSALASSNKGTYFPIQQFAALPEVRKRFLTEAHRLDEAILCSIEGDDSSLASLIDSIAKWDSPVETSGNGGSGPFSSSNVRAMTNAFLVQANRTRAELVQSRGQVRGILDESSSPPRFFLGQLYADPGKHGRVDISSCIRFFHTNVSQGLIEHPDRRIHGLECGEPPGSVPLGTSRILKDDEMYRWLDGAIEAEASESQRRARRIAEETLRLKTLGFVGEKTLTAVRSEDPQKFEVLEAEAKRLGGAPPRKSLDEVRKHLLRSIKERERLTDEAVGSSAETGRFKIKFHRSIRLLVPAWFDNAVARGLVDATQDVNEPKAHIHLVGISTVTSTSASVAEGWKLADVNLQILLHPVEMMKHRCATIQELFPGAEAPKFDWLDSPDEYAFASSLVRYPKLAASVALHSRINQEVAKRAKAQVDQIVRTATDSLLSHGARPVGERREVLLRVDAPVMIADGALPGVLRLLPGIEAAEDREPPGNGVAGSRTLELILSLRMGDVNVVIPQAQKLLTSLGCMVTAVEPPGQGEERSVQTQ